LSNAAQACREDYVSEQTGENRTLMRLKMNTAEDFNQMYIVGLITFNAWHIDELEDFIIDM
ncbi:hypothetical protein, partial [Salmonella enterica]|uniref:hypothetical protein n=1 Tax=Salmonella enterica TaxID=28901 RepID=UPI003EDC2E40